MIAVGNHPKHLLKLIQAIGGHNPRILIKKIGEPAEHAEQKGTQGGVLYIKGKEPVFAF